MASSAPPAQEACQKIVDAACAKEDGPPGIVFGQMDRNGNYIAKVAGGVRGLDKKDEKMTTDNIFAIYSCTKILATIAVMQLVEQGKIGLDDPVEDVLPEIKECKLLDGSAPKRKITLRLLLSHQAGFSYTFFNQELYDWNKKNNLDDIHTGTWDAYRRQPLVFQPGEDWGYSIGIDWAGKVLEAITGETLGEYSRKNIFEPLGCKEIAYNKCKYPERLASLHQIDENGKVHPREHLGLTTKGWDFDSGGAGCSSTLDDYLKCILILVNKGKGANGAQILRPETVEIMWKDQLEGTPAEEKRTLYKPIPVARHDLAYAGPELSEGLRKGWNLSALLTKDPWPTGRSANSCWWAGLVNLFWMADPHKGTVNFVMTQMLPFGSMKTLEPWLACEAACYQAMQ